MFLHAVLSWYFDKLVKLLITVRVMIAIVMNREIVSHESWELRDIEIYDYLKHENKTWIVLNDYTRQSYFTGIHVIADNDVFLCSDVRGGFALQRHIRHALCVTHLDSVTNAMTNPIMEKNNRKWWYMQKCAVIDLVSVLLAFLNTAISSRNTTPVNMPINMIKLPLINHATFDDDTNANTWENVVIPSKGTMSCLPNGHQTGKIFFTEGSSNSNSVLVSTADTNVIAPATSPAIKVANNSIIMQMRQLELYFLNGIRMINFIYRSEIQSGKNRDQTWWSMPVAWWNVMWRDDVIIIDNDVGGELHTCTISRIRFVLHRNEKKHRKLRCESFAEFRGNVCVLQRPCLTKFTCF